MITDGRLLIGADVAYTLDGLAQKKLNLKKAFAGVQAKFGNDCGTITITNLYANMVKKINEYPYLIDLDKQAMTDVGVIPVCEPIRGGTDGAQLSFKGLLTPNILTGGANFHGRFEYIFLRCDELIGEHGAQSH